MTRLCLGKRMIQVKNDVVNQWATPAYAIPAEQSMKSEQKS